MRSGIFTGFITAGSFILTMKTFTIATLKKEVYEDPWYKEYISSLSNAVDVTLYGSLSALKQLLFWCIISCYSISLLQLTLGFFPNIWTSSICLAAAVAGIIFIIVCLKYISNNIDCMLENQGAREKAKSDADKLSNKLKTAAVLAARVKQLRG